MTKDRDFKKLVRSRMRTTGESYSTAISRIRAKRPDTAAGHDTSTWTVLERGDIQLRVPRSWIDLGATDSFEVAHVGPARNMLAGPAALFATEDGPDWLYALGHPFGGLRVFRQEPGESALSVTDAPWGRAVASSAAARTGSGVDGHSATTTSSPTACRSSSSCLARSRTSETRV